MECLEGVSVIRNDTDNNYTLLEVTTDKRKMYCKLPFEKVLLPYSDKKIYRYSYKKSIKDICVYNNIFYRFYFNMLHKDCD